MEQWKLLIELHALHYLKDNDKTVMIDVHFSILCKRKLDQLSKGERV